MANRGYLILMLLADVVAWAGWALVVIYTDPGKGDNTIFAAFYASLFLALLGLFTVIGVWSRQLRRATNEAQVVNRSFRQGFWLALLVIGALVLASNGWLRWWVVILVVAALAAWEAFFLAGEGSSTN